MLFGGCDVCQLGGEGIHKAQKEIERFEGGFTTIEDDSKIQEKYGFHTPLPELLL